LDTKTNGFANPADFRRYLPRWAAKISADVWLAIMSAAVVIGGGVYLGWDVSRRLIPYPTLGFRYLTERHNPLSFIANWDGVDYIHIAVHGYQNLFWVNWFPLYPVLIHLFGRLIPSPLDCALIISWLCLVGAIYFYIKIVRRLFGLTGDVEPLRALVFFLLFPTGVFFIAPFSESLYALLALGAIHFAFKKQWLYSAVLLLACTTTHITGMLVVLLVGMILWEEKLRPKLVVATVAIGSLGLVAYMAYLAFAFDSPLAFLSSQEVFHKWTEVGYLTLVTSLTPSLVINIALLLLAARYWWNRQRSFSIYSLLFLVIPLVGRQYGGFNRYVLMAFPVPFMLYAVLRNRKGLFPYVMLLLGIGWTYYLIQYAGGYIGS